MPLRDTLVPALLVGEQGLAVVDRLSSFVNSNSGSWNTHKHRSRINRERNCRPKTTSQLIMFSHYYEFISTMTISTPQLQVSTIATNLKQALVFIILSLWHYLLPHTTTDTINTRYQVPTAAVSQQVKKKCSEIPLLSHMLHYSFLDLPATR